MVWEFLAGEFGRAPIYDTIGDMRTTLSLDADAFQLVKRYAASRSLTLGKAVSELVRRATVPGPTRRVNGVEVFDLPARSPRVTTKRVRELGARQN